MSRAVAVDPSEVPQGECDTCTLRKKKELAALK